MRRLTDMLASCKTLQTSMLWNPKKPRHYDCRILVLLLLDQHYIDEKKSRQLWALKRLNTVLDRLQEGPLISHVTEYFIVCLVAALQTSFDTAEVYNVTNQQCLQCTHW